MIPPPVFTGERERWEDWSWQVKAYVSLHKPFAQELLTRIEEDSFPIDGFILQQEEDCTYQGQDLVKFSKQLHYLLANITDDIARVIVRSNYAGNGFETWRRLYDRFALLNRAKGVSLLSQLLIRRRRIRERKRKTQRKSCVERTRNNRR